jgi:hypothetical protein
MLPFPDRGGFFRFQAVGQQRTETVLTRDNCTVSVILYDFRVRLDGLQE